VWLFLAATIFLLSELRDSGFCAAILVWNFGFEGYNTGRFRTNCPFHDWILGHYVVHHHGGEWYQPYFGMGASDWAVPESD